MVTMKIVLPHLGGRFALISLSTALIVLAAIAPTYYFYTKYQHSQQLLKNPTQAAAEDLRALVAAVGKVIELPNEEPTLATVTDREKLSSQPFFAKSQNGDKVLIFQLNKKAILYRPSTAKVIEVSTLNVFDGGGSSASVVPIVAPTSTPDKFITVVLYNGTPTVGVTATAEKKLKADAELGTHMTVAAKENAVKRDYTKTIIVVLNSEYASEGEKLAKLLGGTVSVLPEDEVRPTADIVVIIGK